MVYIHVPFCGSFCTYCDFYSEIAGGNAVDSFLSAICQEIRIAEDRISRETNTLYIGGGTPSVLPLSSFSSLVELTGGKFSEFTVEVNPEDIVSKGRAYVEGLVDLGVNRVSMGVQSFNDGMLRWMNRRHDSESALKAFRILRDAGVSNISIDLIFGISHLEDDLWRETLVRALSLRPEHISAYQLSVEPGSVLSGMVRSGKYTEAVESQCRSQYDTLCAMLADAGYRHYEISNFAIPGYEAQHNSAYWRHVPYCGFGPGAHSLDISGEKYVRSWNLPDLGKYLSYYRGGDDRKAQGSDGGQIPETVTLSDISQSELLTAEQVAIETIMLGLRTDSGVRFSLLDSFSEKNRLETLIDKGMLVPVSSDSSFLRIPEKFFFISDNIIADLI